jgi:hypothetical protein
MNLMSHFIKLVGDKRVDELIAYIEGNDFPPDTYKIEEANELRQLRSRILIQLGTSGELSKSGVGHKRQMNVSIQSKTHFMYF